MSTIAVDVAKSVFEIAVSDRPGRVVKRSRLSRSQFTRLLATHSPVTLLMEACGSAHFWGRQATRAGHRVVLLPPHAVRPYVARNKTDRADATALLEAARNEAIQPVPLKSIPQQTIAALHRLRSAWIATRTARLNTVRGLLREFGITIPVGARFVLPRITSLLATDDALPAALHASLLAAADEIRGLDQCIRDAERQLTALAVTTPGVAGCKHSPVSACSPPPRSSPLSATRTAFHRAGTSRAISASLHASTRVGCAVVSARSASAETPICACSSFTAPAPCSGTRSDKNDPRACLPGR